MISSTLVKYVLTAALRDRLMLSMAAVMALGICLALFMASSAVIEPKQFSIVFMGSGLRLLALVSLVLFVVFFVRRSFDARDIEYLLSRPISRATLILSNACAVSILAIIAGAFLSAIIGIMGSMSGYTQGLALWSLGVTCEYILLVNVALFFAMVLSSPVTAGMAVIGFYTLSRMMGEILGIISNPPIAFPGYEVLNGIMKMVSMVIPRLDLMTETSWLIYGAQGSAELAFIILQTAVFIILVLVATLIDLVRRQF